ncbi:MAG: ATP-binding protein [Pseudomonadota bacterium]
MQQNPNGPDDLLHRELEELRIRLDEAEQTLSAIRQGDVDALVVGSDIYTLDSSNAAANKLRQDVLAQMQDAVMAFDAGNHLVFMNAAAEHQYRKSASATLGRLKDEVFTEVWPDGQRAREAAADVLRRQGVFRGSLVHQSADGVQTHVETTISALRDGDAQTTGYLYVIRDITERVTADRALARTAAALAQRERQFSTLVENSPDIFARMDRQFRHLYVSPIVEHFTGLPPAHFIGRTNQELGMPAALYEQWNAAIGRVFDTAGIGRTKFSFPVPGGSERVFDARLIPEFDEQGRVESVLSIAVDVTEQEAANAALKDADRRKDEFLATLAHELRNPLAPIRNALHIMQLSSEAKVKESARKIIERQLAQLVHLVDDLLDVSRITQGKVELRIELADVVAAVHAAVETSRPMIEAGKHELTLLMPPPRTLFVDADVTRLCQIIANLLNNAAKYTPDGGRIAVTATRQDGFAVITVTDSGVGIPESLLPRVFDMFAQVDGSAERSQGGLGIGLALVRQLVEMHGGEVEAESHGPGTGSRFTVRLRESAALPAAEAGADASPLHPDTERGVRVLVVDDNVDSAETMAQFLGILGYETLTAHDGLAAVSAAESFRPDVVVLDIGLPHLNGHEAAKRIRQGPGGGDMLLVALSGWGQSEDRQKSKEAGFDRHFVKPVELEVLMETVARVRGPN